MSELIDNAEEASTNDTEDTTTNNDDTTTTTTTSNNPPPAPLQPLKASIEPDVIVVVGGQEFPEHSFHLRSISGYFDAAIRSGMKEAQQMRFEFPDKAPDEWEFVMSLARPFAIARVTEQNWNVAHGWFDELCIPLGLQACDQVLLEILQGDDFCWIDQPSQVPKMLEKLPVCRAGIRRLLDYLTRSLQSNLAQAKARCLQLLGKLLEDIPTLLDQEDWATLCGLLLEHPGFRSEVWEKFSQHIPTAVQDKEMDALLTNELFPTLIHTEAQRRAKDSGLQVLADEIQEEVGEDCKNVESLKRVVAAKHTCCVEASEKGKFHLWKIP